jgi:hypothetical protein
MVTITLKVDNETAALLEGVGVALLGSLWRSVAGGVRSYAGFWRSVIGGVTL